MRWQNTHCACNQGLALSKQCGYDEQMLNVRERRALCAKHELTELLDEYGRGRAAVLLDVYASTIERWESGKTRIPQAAIVALRAAARGQVPGMQGCDWQGWRIGEDGFLYNPNGQDRYGPGELYAIHWNRQLVRSLQERVAELQARIEDLARPAAAGVPSAANDAVSAG